MKLQKATENVYRKMPSKEFRLERQSKWVTVRTEEGKARFRAQHLHRTSARPNPTHALLRSFHLGSGSAFFSLLPPLQPWCVAPHFLWPPGPYTFPRAEIARALAPPPPSAPACSPLFLIGPACQ